VHKERKKDTEATVLNKTSIPGAISRRGNGYKVT
jgi:hypothetical protein